RKIAIAFYNALTRGLDYVETGVIRYQQHLAQRELKHLHKLAHRYNFQLVLGNASLQISTNLLATT
ncbi:MAG: hypothetical protein LBF85_11505, partial [Tannerella sp.]|nr:hypothetical protein [Tannerella sp.]